MRRWKEVVDTLALCGFAVCLVLVGYLALKGCP